MFYALNIMDVFFEKRRFSQVQAGILQQKGMRKIKKIWARGVWPTEDDKKPVVICWCREGSPDRGSLLK
jgi:hypothetical protein